MSDESDENQTELYHFARGAFVDTDWFPGDLDENDDVVRVSEAGQFPESYYLEEGDWGAAPLVPGDDPPYEGVNLPQALYAAIHWTDGDLARAIGRLPLRDLFIGVEEHDDLSRKLDALEFFRVYLYLRLTDEAETDVAKNLDDPEFRDRLNVTETVSQPTLNRLGDRLTERQMRYFDRVVAQVLAAIEDSRYADQFAELPSPDTEERKPPYIKKLSRELRAEVFRHLSFDRDDSIKFKRDFLLRIFVSAAIHDIHMNQACENMELKSWVGEGNSVDPSNVRHQLLKFDPATVTRMFRQANGALFDIAFEHEYFDDTNEVAIDSTDWGWYGQGDASRDIQKTKPQRNFYYSWQFTTLALVGTNTPMTMRAVPTRADTDKGTLVRRLLRYAAQVTSFNRAYLDSGFYTTDAVRALESTGTEFIIQAPDKGRKIEGLQRLAVAKESEVEAVPHGLGGIDDEKHWLFTVKSQKRSRLRQGEPDDPIDDWIIFYTNIPLDADDVDPLELATDFRNRWGVETSYRKLKHDFLAQSGSPRLATRMFYFKFAILMYNMWTVANVLGAEEQDHDLSSGNFVKANRFTRAFEDDEVTLDLDDPPEVSETTHFLQGFNLA
ncbi:hypothetical protein ELS19_19850 [Halogeometricum borinquense]|uniref:Transposase IS4-like domain-containing protein n=1 Tax=Halogeometricum borinquense TaxID=60847 RepID=A0A482SXY9_9EURY|nr:transposase [Halogeometricum borinquense]RYJ07771.1 hypothetical protein ELS19_19850 [Halogeometricum borinquense]